MNSLDYKEALKIDKRTFSQYYASLLRTNHLFLFSFYPNKDYNSRIIKNFLFFFFFASEMAINAVFYTDSTMHQIYEDEGSFNFIYQIPQIIYSSLLSGIISTIVKYLSLSESSIIDLKYEKKEKKEKKEKNKNPENIDIRRKKLVKSLKIKFALFFIITLIILVCFWYYITCFCGIYRNTQVHLIKNTFASFIIAHVYTIITCLLPSLLRRCALAA